MSLLDQIVNVNIDINSPAVSTESFSHILLVGSEPTTPATTGYKLMGVYYSLAEVTANGWLTTDAVYEGASMAFANGADKVFIAARKATDGVVEDIGVTLTRALTVNGWYGIALCNSTVSASDYTSVAGWADANDKLFACVTDSTTNPIASYNRSAAIYGKVNSTDTSITGNNRFIHVAWLAKCLRYEEGSVTWAFKTLSGITASVIDGTTIATLTAANISYYVECANKSITQGGKVGTGEWIDVIRFRDWLKADMQSRVFSLFTANPKIPYTDGGINLVRNAMFASLAEGQRRGGIASDEYTGNGTVNPGFTVTVPLAANVSAAVKASRILSGCKFSARIAGAIHVANISGSLNYGE